MDRRWVPRPQPAGVYLQFKEEQLMEAAEQLEKGHLEDLRRSGLSDEMIAKCGFRSVSTEEAAKIVGWRSGSPGSSLAIPFFDSDGQDLGYVRLKPDAPRMDDGKPVKYESPKGQSNRAYFPPGVGEAIRKPTERIIITEGEKKAAKATQEGVPTIGLVGVYGWITKGQRDEQGQRIGEDELIPDLAEISWTDRPVTIVFDSDAVNNLDVRRAQVRLAAVLEKAGAKVAVACPPAGPNGEKVGLDDFIIKNEDTWIEHLDGGVLIDPLESCPAPIERELAGHDPWTPIPLPELEGDGEVPWLWKEYLAHGCTTLISGGPKAGKTTLIAHLLKKLDKGGVLATTVYSGRVLIITEEPKLFWMKRRDKHRIGGHVEIIPRPFKGRPSQKDWERFLCRVVRYVQERPFDLVVIDTLADVSPVTDENDAAQTNAALKPVRNITDAGAAVLIVHHLRKSDATQGRAARGSNALTAGVDIIVELRASDAARADSTRRSLTTLSRFDESHPEIVLELTESGEYRMVGTKNEASGEDRTDQITRILANGENLTPQEIHAAWPTDCCIPVPGERTIRMDLQKAVEDELLERSGQGVAGDPFRYRLPPKSCPASSLSIGAGHDTRPARDCDGSPLGQPELPQDSRAKHSDGPEGR